MRGLTASICLVGVACGGGDGAGPSTTHSLNGDWDYRSTQLADGHATTCNALSGSALTLAQNGRTFSGTIAGGLTACQTGGVPWTGGFGQGVVEDGIILGDSVAFYIDNGQWRSFGRFITEDSLAGIVNAVYGNLIMTGYWSATRQ